MPAPDDLALLIGAAEAAGRIARRHFGTGPESWDKGGAQGPVSVADIEINDMLKAELGAARPGYGWLSEESPDDAARLGPERTFIIDPIDGTRAFLAGQHSFAHSLALAEDGEIIAAVVHLPMRDETFSAILGGGAKLNGASLAVSTATQADGARVLSNKASLSPPLWHGAVPSVSRHFRPSLAWRMCLVASGAYDAMLTLRPTWEWDVAAGALIVAEAGGSVRTRHRLAPRFNNPAPLLDGLIAGAPILTEALLARLAPSKPVQPEVDPNRSN